jgi:formate dehydrogenase beta subunit
MREILNAHKMLSSDCIDVPVKMQYRVHNPELDPEIRKYMFGEVEGAISQEDAYREARRCMRCYRIYSVITHKPIPEGAA